VNLTFSSFIFLLCFHSKFWHIPCILFINMLWRRRYNSRFSPSGDFINSALFSTIWQFFSIYQTDLTNYIFGGTACPMWHQSVSLVVRMLIIFIYLQINLTLYNYLVNFCKYALIILFATIFFLTSIVS